MPAPSSTLLEAVRAGNVARHSFIRLDHSQGAIRYWSGLGKFQFDNEIYEGVGNTLSIGGISDSSDLQSHDVTISTNAIPLSAITDIDPSIRGRAFDMWVVWIDLAGTVVASTKVFSGSGNRVQLAPRDTDYTLSASITGAIGDWSMSGDRFYSVNDQAALFPTDTGFTQISGLGDRTLNGWQRVGSVATDLVYTLANFNQTTLHLSDATGVVMGLHTSGAVFRPNGGEIRLLDQTGRLQELASSTPVAYTANGQPVTCIGQGVSINPGTGFAQSINGSQIIESLTAATANGLRRQAAIASTGTQTATAITMALVGGTRLLRDSAKTAAAGNYAGIMYFDSGLYTVLVGATASFRQTITGITFDFFPVVCATASGQSAGTLVPQSLPNSPLVAMFMRVPITSPNSGTLFLRDSRSGSAVFVQAFMSTTGMATVNVPGIGVSRLIPSNLDTLAFLRSWV